MKTNRDVNYWNMTYRGKFRRTLWMIPVVLVLALLTPLYMGGWWLPFDVVMFVVLVWQLAYTYRKMREEESGAPNVED